MSRHYIFSTVLAFLALVNVTSGSTEACLPSGEKKSGMNINFYQYTLKDSSTYSNPEYMAHGYADKEKLGSVSGQTKISIDYNIPCSSETCDCDDESSDDNSSEVVLMKRRNKPCSDTAALAKKRDDVDCDQGAAYWSSDLFGFYTTPTNVTVEMTGYFLAPKTGSYTFGFGTVDDSAILSIGGNVAFDCCKQEQPPVTSTDFTINGIKPWNADAPTNIEGSVYMYAGYYYPMKVVFSNAVSWGTLPISVTLPDGSTVSDDFNGYVYSFDDDLTEANCTVPNPASHSTSSTSSTEYSSSAATSTECTTCDMTSSTEYSSSVA
ncbi:Flo10p DI49_3472, partial [Saccharomyces eubayanus]|uniref:Flo10p n=1 Tax=Saccharomyces eubayanus TaxID=1080349 RepID=UPI0006C1D040